MRYRIDRDRKPHNDTLADVDLSVRRHDARNQVRRNNTRPVEMEKAYIASDHELTWPLGLRQGLFRQDKKALIGGAALNAAKTIDAIRPKEYSRTT
jgi:hypothetical protein